MRRSNNVHFNQELVQCMEKKKKTMKEKKTLIIHVIME